jgi:hypothetical protein
MNFLQDGASTVVVENRAKWSLPSADRNNKATLLLTGLRRTAKSSAKDLSRHRYNCNSLAKRRPLPDDANASLLRREAEAYSRSSQRRVSPRSGMDSSLEAFSYYPADGSSAALPCQAAAKTNYLKERFLSYWALLPLRWVHQ